MPIYEYRCEDGHTVEVMQRISDDPLAECQVCGAPVQRVFHPVAVHFKGKGFYNTDYGTRKRQREKDAADGGSSSGADGASSDGGQKSDAPAKSGSDGGSSNSGSNSGSAEGGTKKGSGAAAS